MRTLEIPQGVDESAEAAGKDSGIATELGAPWGLARISHRAKLTLGTFTKYLYDSEGGEGVTAYVIDTGINVDHVELEGMVWPRRPRLSPSRFWEVMDLDPCRMSLMVSCKSCVQG